MRWRVIGSNPSPNAYNVRRPVHKSGLKPPLGSGNPPFGNGSGWESNPPGPPLQRPPDGFEDRGAHRDSTTPTKL